MTDGHQEKSTFFELFTFLMKIHERSEDSSKGRYDFFIQEKKSFVHTQICFFAVWLLISFFYLSSFPLLKWKANSTIEQQKHKIHEKCDRILVSKSVIKHKNLATNQFL